MSDENPWLEHVENIVTASREAMTALDGMADPPGFDLYWRKLCALHGAPIPAQLRHFSRSAWRAAILWEAQR